MNVGLYINLVDAEVFLARSRVAFLEGDKKSMAGDLKAAQRSLQRCQVALKKSKKKS